MNFLLDPKLEADTHFAADWPLCRVLVMNDSRYPWLVLVPKRENLTEITDLAAADRTLLMEEIARAGEILRALPGMTKLNIGALGNVVPQLHIHIVGRHPGDSAWPGPVWGHGFPRPYKPDRLEPLLNLVRSR